MAIANNWDNKNKHVDTSINPGNYYNSARTVLYVASAQSWNDEGGSYTYTTSMFQPIGLVQGWNWSEQRAIDVVWELGSDLPYMIPGRTQGSISIGRLIINGRDLANICNTPDSAGGVIPVDSQDNPIIIKSLKDVVKPMDLLFVSYSTNDVGQIKANEPLFKRLYRNCWIVARNEAISANQAIIAENVSILYQDMPNVEIKSSNPLGS